MITSSSNAKVKQVIQWQNKAKERRAAGVFLTEGSKMFEEAPVSSIIEVYVAQSALEKITEQAKRRDKLLQTGYEVVTDALFAKMSDTQTPFS